MTPKSHFDQELTLTIKPNLIRIQFLKGQIEDN